MGLFGLSKEIKEQIEEELKVVLCSGFFSELSILVRAQDTIEEICEENEVRMPSERYCLSLLKKIKKKYAVSGNNENFNRLHNVFSQLNQENIIAIHYADCEKVALSVVYEEMQRIEKVGGITEGYCYYGEYELETVLDKQILSLTYGSHNASETHRAYIGEILLNIGQITLVFNNDTGRFEWVDFGYGYFDVYEENPYGIVADNAQEFLDKFVVDEEAMAALAELYDEEDEE